MTVASMLAELADKRQYIADLDRELRDYYNRRDLLVASIIRTFPHRECNAEERRRGPAVIVTGYSRENRQERAELHAELDRLREVFAPTVNERRNTQIEADALARAIDRLIEWERKHPQKEMAL